MNLRLLLLSLALSLSVVVAMPCVYPGGNVCDADQYCSIDVGKCTLGIASQSGMCATKGNMACPMNIAPVCGCDMITYDNACKATMAGVNIMSEGACDAPVGGDYCTWSPDGACFLHQWPQCCLDKEQPCPPDRQPRCDNRNTPGWDYCTYAPDTECYESGWPTCCERFNGTNCPTDQPSCDVPGIEATFPKRKFGATPVDGDAHLPSTASLRDEPPNCTSRERWSAEKRIWCCKHENRGCLATGIEGKHPNCMTRERWSTEKEAWCCKHQNLGCSTDTE